MKIHEMVPLSAREIYKPDFKSTLKLRVIFEQKSKILIPKCSKIFHFFYENSIFNDYTEIRPSKNRFIILRGVYR